jgi:hypothetical protein
MFGQTALAETLAPPRLLLQALLAGRAKGGLTTSPYHLRESERGAGLIVLILNNRCSNRNSYFCVKLRISALMLSMRALYSASVALRASDRSIIRA